MLFLLIAACLSADDEEWEVQEVEGGGFACLMSAGELDEREIWDEDPLKMERTFTADSSIAVWFNLDTCGSYSCSQNPQASCTVDVEGARITIEARGSWEDNVAASGCTFDCGFWLEGSCSLGDLPEGEYTVVYGADVMPLQIPSTQASCVGDLESW